MRILLKDYKLWARDTSVTLCKTIEAPAEQAGLYRFLNNSKDSKEETALQLAKEHGRTEGLIAVLGCVEPCQVMQVRGNRQTKQLELRVEPGKCKHYYHYYLDPEYGLRYTALAELGPVHDAYRAQWTRLAGAADWTRRGSRIARRIIPSRGSRILRRRSVCWTSN